MAKSPATARVHDSVWNYLETLDQDLATTNQTCNALNSTITGEINSLKSNIESEVDLATIGL